MHKTTSLLLILVSSLVLASCSSALTNVRRSSLSSNEKIVFGRIHVVKNGVDVTEYCSSALQSFPKPHRVGFDLNQDGLLHLRIYDRPYYLESVTCKVSGEKYYEFPSDAVILYPNQSITKKVFLGDIWINWQVKGEQKVKPSAAVVGALGAAVAGSAKDSGMVVKVYGQKSRGRRIADSISKRGIESIIRFESHPASSHQSRR